MNGRNGLIQPGASGGGTVARKPTIERIIIKKIEVDGIKETLDTTRSTGGTSLEKGMQFIYYDRYVTILFTSRSN